MNLSYAPQTSSKDGRTTVTGMKKYVITISKICPSTLENLVIFVSLYSYADDNSMSVSSENIQRVLNLLQNDCTKAVQWVTSNGMQANPKTFQCMLLSSCNIDVGNICLYVGDTLLSPEPCVKVLGVTIDRCLTFSNHVINLYQIAAKQLHALARISRYPYYNL